MAKRARQPSAAGESTRGEAEQIAEEYFSALNAVHWTMSGEVVLMTLVGGLGTIFGPVVGALIVLAMENYLAQLGAWVTIVQGFVFVFCVLAFRRGIVGELTHFLHKRDAARARDADQASMN